LATRTVCCSTLPLVLDRSGSMDREKLKAAPAMEAEVEARARGGYAAGRATLASPKPEMLNVAECDNNGVVRDVTAAHATYWALQAYNGAAAAGEVCGEARQAERVRS